MVHGTSEWLGEPDVDEEKTKAGVRHHGQVKEWWSAVRQEYWWDETSGFSKARNNNNVFSQH